MKKTIGLLGGMSWESTADYYRLLNSGVKARLGGLHSARLVLHSVDFAPLERLLQEKNWTEIAAQLSAAAKGVEAAGADFLLLCTNTMHRVAPEIASAIQIPLLHIADAAAERLVAAGVKCVGLLGTAFTMEEMFYRGRLTEKFGLDVLVPTPEERRVVNRIIFEELCLGVTTEESRCRYLRVIDGLAGRGAESVLLGCTEIELLVKQSDTEVPLLDTTAVHAEAAVEQALC